MPAKNFLITISGTPGSGKSTIAEALAKKLRAKRIYVGGIMRQIAKERKITLADLQKQQLNDPNIDVAVDKRVATQAKESAKKQRVIVEGRTQFYFLPKSLKLYIKVNPREGAKRIWLSLQKPANRIKRNEAQVNSLKELLEKNLARRANDLARYKKYYGFDYTDESQYDFVLDTTKINAQQAITKTLEFVKNKLNI